MKNTIVTLFCITFLVLTPKVQAQYSLFDTTYLHEIKITSTDPNFWQQLDDDYQNWLDNNVDIPYHATSVEIDGNILADVGIRQKGYSSNFFTFSKKKPLKLHFSKFVADRRFDGVKKVNLMNGVGDAAIAKDKMVYNMFRMHGVPGPRVAHTKIYINNVYWGIYALIEQVDKRYLKRNFADSKGNLWKNKGNSELAWQGAVQANYPFELQTNETTNDWTKFYEFIEFINTSTNADFSTLLADKFELDEYFRILAIDILINNWDSYLDHGRNWYMYHEPKTNKMHWLPWDYNFAFDRFPNGSDDLSLIQNNQSKVLTKRVFEIPAYKTRILDYMCEILEVNFTTARLHPFLDSQFNLVINDWGSNEDFFTTTDVTDFINAATWNGSFSGAGSQGIKKFVTDRRTVIQNDLANAGHTCTNLATPINSQDVVINEFMANNDDGSPWADLNAEHDDWIELFNNTASSISLKNYFLSDDESFIHKWELPADAIIPANGYLIIWADKDPQQTGLHTKFSLSSDKGKVILSYLDNTIIDTVSYDTPQDINKSLSRIPNGTGAFEVGTVTFNAENEADFDLIFTSGFEQ